MSRGLTKAEELQYLTSGLNRVLKGAVITGVKLGRLREGDFAPPLLMSVKFPKPVKYRCDGQDFDRVTTMEIFVSQDPEGNGPGALIAETFQHLTPA